VGHNILISELEKVFTAVMKKTYFKRLCTKRTSCFIFM